jgi:hypothetical protein
MVNPPRDPFGGAISILLEIRLSGEVGKTTIQFQGVDRILDDSERPKLAQDFKTAFDEFFRPVVLIFTNASWRKPI